MQLKSIYIFLCLLITGIGFSQQGLPELFHLKDSLAQAKIEKQSDLVISNLSQWRLSVEDHPDFYDPALQDSSWATGNIPSLVDSLKKLENWKPFMIVRLHFKADSLFYALNWWLKLATISPTEIYLDGNLIMKNGNPAISKEEEVIPVFSADKPFYTVIPNRRYHSDHVLAIRWSGHQALLLERLFPGIFIENGPLNVFSPNDPFPAFEENMHEMYLRVYFGSGLLFLVLFVQGYLFYLGRSRVNFGIGLVAFLLLLHLFISHSYFFGQSIYSMAIDGLLFLPLFISIFSLFPWLAAKMMHIHIPFSDKKFTLIVITLVLVGIVILGLIGTSNMLTWIFILLFIALDFAWLVYIMNKANSKRAPYRTIISLAYFLPIGIVLLSYVLQLVGSTFGFDLITNLEKYNWINPLIITVYIAVPVLTTVYIARQNYDLLQDLSKQVSDRTADLQDSLAALKTTQSQLVHSEKMASLGELTAGIAHEIQNPLNFVNNFSEVSKELLTEMQAELKFGNTEEVRVLAEDVIQNLEKINHHGKRADAIVKNMLQHSRKSGNTKKITTDINTLVKEYAQLGYQGFKSDNKQKEVRQELHLTENLPMVSVISEELGRVILNLLANAYYVVMEKQQKASTEITADLLPFHPKVSITTQKQKEGINIIIADNGSGIPEEVSSKIFQPFFTTKPTGKGTGLGLSIAFNIVTKAHGGKLQFTSNPGEGTQFCIVLPVEGEN